MDLGPALILAMWTAGLAAGGSAVAAWRIVGPGYGWLAAAVTVGVGIFVVLAGGGVWAIVGVTAAAIAGLFARRPPVSTAAFAVAALAFIAAAWTDSPLGVAVSGALMVGGITSEMLLGHWYLVDPRLPRWALFRLTAAGAAGLMVDAVAVAVQMARNGVQTDSIFGWAYVALALMTGLLVTGVWFSLREPRYTGVMAATGLAYLAVLTSLGVLVVGRLIGW